MIDPLSPDTYVGFGEDGTAVGSAAKWSGTIRVLGISSTTTDLKLDIRTSGAPSKLGALGEVFSASDPDAPTTINRGNASFMPVPAVLTTEIRLAPGRQLAIVTSPTPTKLRALVDLITPGNERTIDATVDRLQASVDIVHESGDGHQKVTYAAGAPTARLRVHYRHRTGSATLTAARLDATDVPARIAFDQTGGRTTVDAAGGSFGAVEARFARGGEVPATVAGGAPYAAFHRLGAGRLTAGLRLRNLKSVAIDAAGAYIGRLVFSSPLGSLGFSARDDVSSTSLTGSLSDLPLDTAVAADPGRGIVTFDGHGQGIGRIALQAKKSSGTFFGRATRVDATIEAIPATETIAFGQSAGGLTATATNPPGAITLLASDGSDAPPVDGSYAWYEDTPSRYRAFARLSGLKGIAFSPTPVAGSIDTSAAQVLSLHGEAGGVTVDGRIDQLPSHVEFTVPNDRVHVESSSAIDRIEFTARNLPAAASFRNAKVDILGISPVVDIYLGVDPATAGSAAGQSFASGSESTSADMRALDQNCPPQEGPCDQPPCPREAEACDEPPCPPEEEGCDDPPPPPPPPPARLYGIDAHGDGIDLITVHAWANDADLPSHPDLTGPGNEIRYDAKVAGHEDLRARIVNLKKAFYIQNALPTNDTDDVDIEFTQPEPVTLGIKKERLDGTITIPQVGARPLPTRYGLRLGTQRVIHAHFTPNATIPTVQIALAAGRDLDGGERRALITGHVDNVPTSAEVCIARDSFPDCGGWLFDAPGGASNIVIPGEIDFNLVSNGPPVTDPNAMSVTARICLGDIGSDAWVPGSCALDQVAKRYVDIENLRVRNLDLEYRGDGVARKYQGNFGGDDSLAAYLNTDGILVDDFRYVKDGGKGIQFIKSGAPLTAQDFFAALNYSASVRFGFMHGPVGTLSCPPSTSLHLLERDSVTGQVSRYDLPGPISNDLWDYVTLVIDC